MVVDYIQFVGSREGVGVKRVQTTVPKENPRSPHHAHSKLTEIRPLGPPLSLASPSLKDTYTLRNLICKKLHVISVPIIMILYLHVLSSKC